MNRIERLTAIVLLPQGRKRTAGELAARFELSRRTILRDVEALSEVGLPIVADAGYRGPSHDARRTTHDFVQEGRWPR